MRRILLRFIIRFILIVWVLSACTNNDPGRRSPATPTVMPEQTDATATVIGLFPSSSGTTTSTTSLPPVSPGVSLNTPLATLEYDSSPLATTMATADILSGAETNPTTTVEQPVVPPDSTADEETDRPSNSLGTETQPAPDQFAIFLPLIMHTDSTANVAEVPAPVVTPPDAPTQPAPAVLPSDTSGPPATAPTISPTFTPIPTIDERITFITLYDDQLHSDWTAEQSQGVQYDLATTSHIYSNQVAAAITPNEAYGKFFLTVREDAQAVYRRDRILGLSFWLSGGPYAIEPGDLAVTVVGSNAHPYWVAEDNSVQLAAGISDAQITEDSPLFSETRLYFLDINRTIPPNTWVEVVLWLDEREFDPDYTYVTGIYIKNDAALLETFYVDWLNLLLERR